MSAVSSVRQGAAAIGRPLVALSVAVAAVALVANHETVRALEAVLVRRLIAAVTEGSASAAGSIVYFGVGTSDVVGLSITLMCSTVVLAAPLLALSAGIVGITRATWPRVLLASAVSIALVLLTNFARFMMAAAAYTQAGHEGFDVVHRYVGSLFVIAGFIGAIVLLLTLALRERPRRAASVATTQSSPPSAASPTAQSTPPFAASPTPPSEPARTRRELRQRAQTAPRRRRSSKEPRS